MKRLIFRLVIILLGIIAWILLFFINWKIAILLFFINWGQNEAKEVTNG